MAKAQAAGAAAGAEKKGKTKKFKKKERKHVPHGLVTINASFNNTIVTISDPSGNVLSWKSSGSLGFRGSRKGTPFAAQQAAMNAANIAREHGVRSVDGHDAAPRAARTRLARETNRFVRNEVLRAAHALGDSTAWATRRATVREAVTAARGLRES